MTVDPDINLINFSNGAKNFLIFEDFRIFNKTYGDMEDIIKNSGLIRAPSRICLMEVELKLEGYNFYRRGEVAFNIEDLVLLLKCNKEDKATTELIFGEKYLSVKIISEKNNSVIERTDANAASSFEFYFRLIFNCYCILIFFIF